MKEKREHGSPYKIDSVTRLTREQEHVLGLRILAGDSKAVDELALSLMKWAWERACVYSKKYGIPVRDLVQVVYIDGLRKAASGYDTRKGYRFSTYANYWIGSALKEYVKKMKKDADTNAISLYEKNGGKDEEESPELIEVIENDQSPNPAILMSVMELREKIRKTIGDANLNDTEIIIISHIYGINNTPQIKRKEIARRLGITKNKVIGIETGVLRKLKRILNEND